jgi:hypothetical protein
LALSKPEIGADLQKTFPPEISVSAMTIIPSAVPMQTQAASGPIPTEASHAVG